MSAQREQPCPVWCTDCTGWQGPDGIDGRTHRRRFPVANSFVEVYAIELPRFGRIYEQGAEGPEVIEFMSPADLLALSIALTQAAHLMLEHGIEPVTFDPVRLRELEAAAG